MSNPPTIAELAQEVRDLQDAGVRLCDMRAAVELVEELLGDWMPTFPASAFGQLRVVVPFDLDKEDESMLQAALCNRLEELGVDASSHIELIATTVRRKVL